jgi:hypothetical protein
MESKAHGGANGDHERDDEEIANRVGDDSSGQNRRSRNREGAEAVDHAARQVFGDRDAGLRAPKPIASTNRPGSR